LLSPHLGTITNSLSDTITIQQTHGHLWPEKCKYSDTSANEDNSFRNHMR